VLPTTTKKALVDGMVIDGERSNAPPTKGINPSDITSNQENEKIRLPDISLRDGGWCCVAMGRLRLWATKMLISRFRKTSRLVTDTPLPLLSRC
jgi:hypothetical protein